MAGVITHYDFDVITVTRAVFMGAVTLESSFAGCREALSGKAKFGIFDNDKVPILQWPLNSFKQQ